MNLTIVDKAYIAGIIDGEGSICLSKDNASNQFRYPNIQVSSTTYEILQYLKDKIGGSISKRTETNEKYKQSWKWQIKTNLTIELLEQIVEYLLVPEKIYRAKLIINEYKQVTPRNGKYSEEKIKAKLDFEKRFFESK